MSSTKEVFLLFVALTICCLHIERNMSLISTWIENYIISIIKRFWKVLTNRAKNSFYFFMHRLIVYEYFINVYSLSLALWSWNWILCLHFKFYPSCIGHETFKTECIALSRYIGTHFTFCLLYFFPLRHNSAAISAPKRDVC